MRIRVADVEDLPVLQEIERAAGRSFRDVGMPEIAEDEPLPLDDLTRYQRAGRVWVAVDGSDRPVAYLIADLADGNIHVEQVSVHPDHAGHGVGRALLERPAVRAAADGVPTLTLTTFARVPWNAPYYARCGFRCLTDTELTPGLRAIRKRGRPRVAWTGGHGCVCVETCDAGLRRAGRSERHRPTLRVR